MNQENKGPPRESRSEQMLTGFSRFMVGLMWAILLVVVLVVAYLANRFYT